MAFHSGQVFSTLPDQADICAMLNCTTKAKLYILSVNGTYATARQLQWPLYDPA